jgi:ubiquinone/menaquinone biosynthesis C-methylase UbiE
MTLLSMLQNADCSWKSVWERKGREAAAKSAWTVEDLLSADGFDGAMAQTGAAAQDHIARLITESLAIRPGMRIVEVGCGAGAALSLLRSTGSSFTGVDYSAPLIDIARAALPEMQFHVAEAASLPLPDGAFDAGFSYGVFLYFPDVAYASAVLREMVRVVRPGAPILILDVPDAAKREACEDARRASGAALNPPHCYYPKQFFEEFAAAAGRHAKIEDQAVPGYANSAYRYNVLL